MSAHRAVGLVCLFILAFLSGIVVVSSFAQFQAWDRTLILYSDLRRSSGGSPTSEWPSFLSEYLSLLARQDVVSYVPVALVQCFCAALIAVTISLFCVFYAEYLAVDIFRKLFYALLTFTFFVAPPVRALGFYYGMNVFAKNWAEWLGIIIFPADGGPSYLAYFTCLVLGLVPAASFPISIMARAEARLSKRVVIQMRNPPMLKIFVGLVRSIYPALAFSIIISFSFAVGAYHESRQYEQVGLAKIVEALESSTYGELYAFCVMFLMLCFAVVYACSRFASQMQQDGGG